MAYTGDVHRYIEFTQAVKHDLQQKDSRLMPIVTEVTNQGKMQMHDFLGDVGNFDPITGRHANTKLTEVEHKRRAITCKPYAKTFLIDDEDVARQAHNIGSQYVKAGTMAYRRTIDAMIYAGLNASVMAGEDGTTLVARPTTDDIGAQGQYNATTGAWEASGAASDEGLTIDKLRRAKNRLKVNYADELGDLCFVCHPDSVNQLLGTTEVTSSDYNTVKALVQGEVGTFMGFEFVEYNDVTDSGTVYDCYAVAKGSMYLASQKSTGGLRTETSRRADKNNATQIQLKYDKGVSRMYDEAIIEVKCAK